MAAELQQPTIINIDVLRQSIKEKPALKPRAEQLLGELVMVGGVGPAEDNTHFKPKDDKLKAGDKTIGEFDISPTGTRPDQDKPTASLLSGQKQGDKTVYRPIPYDKGGIVPVASVKGIRLTYADGTKADISIDQFDMIPPKLDTAPTPEPTPAPTPEPAPVNPEPAPSTPAALTELEKRAKEPPKSISLIALDIDQSIQALSGKDMEKIAAKEGNWFQKLKRGIWEKNVALELLQEHAYQFRKRQMESAHMLLSDQTLATIEQRAKVEYDAHMDSLKKTNGLAHTWTRFKDYVARNIGATTTFEEFTIAETGKMAAANQLDTAQEYANSVDAIRVRYEHDFQNADGVIRHELGEKLDIFKSGDARHKVIVDGIKDIVHKYADGSLATTKDLEAAMTEFAKAQKIGANSKTGQEAQLYASSLFDVAKEARTRKESGLGMTELDAQLDAMDVRVGRAQMGEATQIESTATRKSVEWMMAKNVTKTLMNEGTLGTAMAVFLSLSILPRFTASRAARLVGGAVGGGAVAAIVTRATENRRLWEIYGKHMRQREGGGGLPQAGDKERLWMQKREVPQVEVSELVNRMTASAYKDGAFNQNISTEDVTKTLAHLANAKALRALSARGGRNVSLIRWGAASDATRTNLDLSIDKLEKDLLTKFKTDTRPEFGGKNITEFTKLLTDTQTAILRDGLASVQAAGDPLLSALGEVSHDAPSITKFRGNILTYFGKEVDTGSKVEGSDNILKELNTQIGIEANNRGVRAGFLGAAWGTGITEALGLGGQLLTHAPELQSAAIGAFEHALNIDTHVPTHLMDLPLPHYADAQGIDHALQVQLPDHTQLVPHGNEGAYWLTNDKGDILVHGIHIDPHTGQIVDAHALNSVTEVTKQGFHFENEVLSNGVGPEGTTGGTFDISVKDMGPGGFSGWMLDTLHAKSADVTHDIPATNLHKHLFQIFEQKQDYGNTDISQIEGYHRIVPIVNGELQYKRLPDNMWFHDVPNVFNPEGQINMGHVMDNAIALHDKVVADGHFTAANMPNWHVMMSDMEAADPANGHLYALAWKVGVVDQLPTDAEFNDLMSLLGAGNGPVYTGLISQTLGANGFNFGDVVLPSVVPLPRDGMKPGSKPIPQPIPEKPEEKKIEEKKKESEERSKTHPRSEDIPVEILESAKRIEELQLKEKEKDQLNTGTARPVAFNPSEPIIPPNLELNKKSKRRGRQPIL